MVFWPICSAIMNANQILKALKVHLARCFVGNATTAVIVVS